MNHGCTSKPNMVETGIEIRHRGHLLMSCTKQAEKYLGQTGIAVALRVAEYWAERGLGDKVTVTCENATVNVHTRD